MVAPYFMIVACICNAAPVLAFGNVRLPINPLPNLSFLPTTSMSATKSSNTEQQIQPPSFFAYPLTQVVSDIDDTLKSSGGVTIAGVTLGGVDVQYDRGDFYPGVFQFIWELSSYSVTINQRYHDEHFLGKGGYDISLDQRISPPKVAVLTARAEEFKAALEIKDGSKLAQAFRKTGESSEINPTEDWGVGPVLYGSVSEWIIQYKKGLRKFNNFERLLEQDPTGQIMQVCFLVISISKGASRLIISSTYHACALAGLPVMMGLFYHATMT